MGIKLMLRLFSLMAAVCVMLLQVPLEAKAAETARKEVAMSFTAKSAYLMEQDTGKELFAQNETQKLAPASLTKLMDLLLILEAVEEGQLTMDQNLTCSAYAKTMGGSEIWLKEGEQMTVEELLKALIVASANDAAVVFAEKLAFTEQGFVDMMNRKAQEMKLVNTQYKNCTGFDEEGHYTCAKDVAVIARELMNRYSEQIIPFSTIWMDSLRGGETELVNTNRLVRFYEGTTGLKTGTTDNAGHCLCATATRGELSLIGVIMGCKTSQTRFEESKQLLDFGFTNFTRYRPENVEKTLEPVKVHRGIPETVIPKILQMPQAVIRREEAEKAEIKLNIFSDLTAPLEKGQEIGKAELWMDGKILASQPVTAAEKVEELTWLRSMGILLRGLLLG